MNIQDDIGKIYVFRLSVLLLILIMMLAATLIGQGYMGKQRGVDNVFSATMTNSKLLLDAQNTAIWATNMAVVASTPAP